MALVTGHKLHVLNRANFSCCRRGIHATFQREMCSAEYWLQTQKALSQAMPSHKDKSNLIDLDLRLWPGYHVVVHRKHGEEGEEDCGRTCKMPHVMVVIEVKEATGCVQA